MNHLMMHGLANVSLEYSANIINNIINKTESKIML